MLTAKELASVDVYASAGESVSLWFPRCQASGGIRQLGWRDSPRAGGFRQLK